MKKTCSTLLLGLQAVSLLAQQPAPPSPVIKSNAQEVLLDIIARDKRGKPVRDLEAGDITVTDDGTKQQIKSFRLVKVSEAAGGGSASGSVVKTQAALNPLRQVRLITLIFEGLGQDGRRLARDGALDLLKTEMGENVFFGVFTIDHQLRVLQQFTADRAVVRKAVEKATSGAFTQFAADSAQIQHSLEGMLGTAPGDSQAVRDGLSANVSAQNNPADFVNQRMAQLTLNMLQASESMAAEQQGRSSITSLINMVREQTPLPGRKTFVYFSEGLEVPESMRQQLQTLIGLANRGNISIYSVDSRGLSLARQNQGAMDMLADAANSSKSQAQADGGAVRRDQVEVFDRANDSLRANKQNNLAEISEATGGALIANSNDVRNAMRRLSEDVGAYYEIAYSPEIDKFDGRFRKVSVSVGKADVKLQTRTGYFALPYVEGQSLLPYEVPLLSALTANPLVRSFPYHATALRFRPQGSQVQAELVIDVPMKEVTFTRDEANKLYRTHFSALMLVKDGEGNIVEKFSKDVPLQGPLDKVEQYQKGEFILTNPIRVAPGRYTLETAVLDQQSSKVSAKKSVFMVPASKPGVGLSSIALVRRVDKVQTPDTKDPLQIPGGAKVTPSLAESIPSGPNAALPLFFVIYPQQSANDKPQVTIEFLQDGKALGGGAPELPAPDASGAIPYMATMPLASLKPGQYEVRVTARQGGTAAQEHIMVTVE